ncbi:MAG: isoprenyl transferase [Peptococcaceae bacterium]|jgi:undecaprenyl diphosphate synthase|nr:isoprenyl transferase [Peptococcaceae bacterium]
MLRRKADWAKAIGWTDEEKKLLALLDRSRVPVHVAIIMDGNGRWARSRGLPRGFGHRAGVESLREVVRASSDLGIGMLTVYAFSTENWRRPSEEVGLLMNLLVEYLNREMEELCANGVRVNAIGRTADLPPAAVKALEWSRAKSAGNEGLLLNLALNYGGRAEIVDAVKGLVGDVVAGKLAPDQVDEKAVGRYLYTTGLPDPDLLIRPAGDLRLSNFLLWQLAYTEFWLTPVLWPDFRRLHLLKALVDFQRRERRFGGLHNP